MIDVEKGQVGPESEHLITKLRDSNDDLAVGNVLRRTCQWGDQEIGKLACKEECQLRARGLEELGSRNGRCADQNLDYLLAKEGLDDKKVLIIGVTANEVGFGDKLEEYDVVQKPTWQELPGFNSFFAREGEVDALGRRLADCADINFELKDSEGRTVIGFEHGTRTNMFGKNAYQFEREDEKVSFTEYALGQAIEHYGADPKSVNIKLAAAIQGYNFTKHFNSPEAMEEHLPGWFEAGYLKNVTQPDWQPGDEVVKSDTWEADTRGMIVHDIRSAMDVFGIPEDNFSMDGIIDPGDSDGEHSSHQFRDKFGDSRDLYMTYFPQRD